VLQTELERLAAVFAEAQALVVFAAVAVAEASAAAVESAVAVVDLAAEVVLLDLEPVRR
jgi:hypothetical protein